MVVLLTAFSSRRKAMVSSRQRHDPRRPKGANKLKLTSSARIIPDQEMSICTGGMWLQGGIRRSERRWWGWKVGRVCVKNEAKCACIHCRSEESPMVSPGFTHTLSLLRSQRSRHTKAYQETGANLIVKLIKTMLTCRNNC